MYIAQPAFRILNKGGARFKIIFLARFCIVQIRMKLRIFVVNADGKINKNVVYFLKF